MTEELKTPAPVTPGKTTEIVNVDKAAGTVDVKELIPEHSVVTKVNKMMAQRQKDAFVKHITMLEKQISTLEEKIAMADEIIAKLS